MNPDVNIVSVHYWKELKDFKRLANPDEKLFLLIHDRAEIDVIAAFISNLHTSSVLYISITKSARVVRDGCKDLAASVTIVDCVTSGIFKTIVTDNCMYENAPYSLFELEALLTNMIDKVKSDYVIFDSLSQFFDGSPVEARDFNLFCDRLTSIGPGSRKIFLCDEASKLLRIIPRSQFDAVIGLEVFYG